MSTETAVRSTPVVPPTANPTLGRSPSQPLDATGQPAFEAEPGALTLADFESMAIRNNPTLAEAAAKVEVSRGKALQAGLWPNPYVAYQAEQMASKAGKNAAGLGEMQGLVVRQEIPSAHKRQISRRKYEWETESARWHAAAQQLRVLNGIRIHFFETLAAQQMLDSQEALLKIADAALRTTEEMVNNGQANSPDLLAAQIQRQQAQVAAIAARNQFRRAWVSLVATTGQRSLPPMRLMGSLDADAPDLDFDAALAHIIQNSPELKAAQAEVQRDATTVQRERVEPIPNLFVQTTNGYNFQDQSFATSLQVGGFVPVWNKNQGTILQAQSDLARAQANVYRIQLSLEKRLADAFARYDTALASTRTFRNETLPRAKKVYELLLESYRRKRAAWPQVLVAQRNWVDMNLSYTTSLFSLRQAEVEINGLLLVDGLSEPPGPNPLGHIDAVAQPR